MSKLFLIFFGIVLIALIAFLLYRNQKDKKDLIDQLNNDYRKPKENKGDIEIDETMK